MIRRRPRRSGSSGFTLVEMLVALTLLALLSSLLYGGLREGARAWRAVEARSTGIERVEAVHSFLRAQIAALERPAPERPAAAGAAREAPDNASFVGEETGFAFTTAAFDAMPVAGPYRLAVLASRSAAGGLSLELHWRPAGGGAAAPAVGSELAGERPLLERLAEARFAYFGGAEGERGAWRTTWPAEAGPPRLVAIDIAFEDDARDWPRFVAAVP